MPSLPRRKQFLLELDLSRPLVESEPSDPIAALRSRGRPHLHATVRALHEAADDDRVLGLIATIASGIPITTAQEVRDAVVAFARSGKLTVARADSFGEDANGTVAYYLATGFREIWLQPSGGVGLLGVAAETTFLRGALDKLGIDPQLSQRYEYKNAADRITRTEFTDAHREALTAVTGSMWDGVVAGIAEGRGMSAAAVRELADGGPLLAPAARERGLVDRLGYRDEAYADVRRRLPADVRLRYVDRWQRATSPPKRAVTAVTARRKPVVGLVEVRGAIVTGHNRRSPLDGPQAGSGSAAAALRAAQRDDHVRAVVLRVDSPGGSYVASDTIWREVVATRDAGKPVVVSMGTAAASGGYFIACPADVIVAQPATLTGSIGVFGGKAVVSELLSKAGITTDAVAHGDHARIYSPRTPFTDAEWELVEAALDAVYADFIGKVAAGRHLTAEQVHEVARGRVWTGKDAHERGLVDQLGGLRTAASIARERAGLPATARLRPLGATSPLALLSTPKSSDDPPSALRAGWGLDISAGMRPADLVLRMPDLTIR